MSGEAPNLPGVVSGITQQNFDALNGRLGAVESDLVLEGWNAPTLLNSFVNYEAAGTYRTVAYRKGTDNRVQVRGLVKRSGSVAGSLAIFQLPGAFRPSKAEIFTGWASLSVGSPVASTRIDVTAAGEVLYAGAAASAIDFLALSQISFYAD